MFVLVLCCVMFLTCFWCLWGVGLDRCSVFSLLSTCSVYVGAWCSDPSTLVLFQVQFWFCVGVRTLTLQVWSCCGSVRSRVRSGHALLCPCAFVVFLLFCLVLCSTQLVFFTGCVLSCLPCFVWTRGLWVSLLAACSCPILQMASDSVLLTIYLVSWLLVNLPHLCQLVTLFICSLYNLLMFAVLGEFFVVCCVCLLSCPALSSLASLFSPTG